MTWIVTFGNTSACHCTKTFDHDAVTIRKHMPANCQLENRVLFSLFNFSTRIVDSLIS
jgi:hypothetical protein